MTKIKNKRKKTFHVYESLTAISCESININKHFMMLHNLYGAPIKTIFQEKFIISVIVVEIFLLLNLQFYRRFQPHMQQSSLQYLVLFKNYTFIPTSMEVVWLSVCTFRTFHLNIDATFVCMDFQQTPFITIATLSKAVIVVPYLQIRPMRECKIHIFASVYSTSKLLFTKRFMRSIRHLPLYPIGDVSYALCNHSMGPDEAIRASFGRSEGVDILIRYVVSLRACCCECDCLSWHDGFSTTIKSRISAIQTTHDS